MGKPRCRAAVLLDSARQWRMPDISVKARSKASSMGPRGAIQPESKGLPDQLELLPAQVRR
jgi:hypothetical protein